MVSEDNNEKELKKETFKPKNEIYQLVPIISGSAALLFLGKVVFSNLPYDRLVISVIATLVVFTISAFMFWSLKRAEQEKDKYLLSTVGKIVEDVFKHYGVTMAKRDAASTAKEMNPIMQTIVNLVSGLRELMKKGYTKSG